jgi:hypothetical protein
LCALRATEDDLTEDYLKRLDDNAPRDLVKALTDHAALIRKMDAIANADGPTQTNEATAKLLDWAARVITLYRARYPEKATDTYTAAQRQTLGNG